MDIKACMTSKSDEWETPQDFFDMLDREFRFIYDMAATKENKKCPLYLPILEESLRWQTIGRNMRGFCNPPYSKIDDFVRNCYMISHKYNWTVVMLIPSRTDTRYWHDYIMEYAHEIRFVKGRLKFSNSKGGAPFPSAVIVFKGWKRRGPAPLISTSERR